MACYIVIFELKNSEHLPSLNEALKAFSGFCPLTPHSWAITAESKASDIRAQLTKHLGPDDQLFVIRSGTEAAWRNSYGEKHNEWLKKNL
jgi:hypothetical protein